MTPEICLEHLKENRYHVVDCETGKSAGLGDKRKRTRAPSKYNLHMKDCLKKTSGPIKQRFKSCAEEWKRKK